MRAKSAIGTGKMDVAGSSKLRGLDRFLDYFIPEKIAADRATAQRARIFLLSHFAGPFLGNVLPLYLWISGFPADYRLLFFATVISAFWAFPLLLKWTGSYVPLAVLSIQNLIFVILWACYSYGGLSSPFMPWLVTIPLLAFFYLNPQGNMKYWILAMIGANVALLYVLNGLGMQFPDVDMSNLQGPGILSMVSASAYVAMMAIYYANILASQVDLENEVRQHKETALELRDITETAHRSGAAKSDFVANMSHELRTPLNAVIGYSQMLMEDALIEGDQETADDLNRIQTAGQHLLRLVNDVLDFSKIEAGKMEVSPNKVSLVNELNLLAEAKRTDIEKNYNQLILNFDQDLGEAFIDWPLVAKVISHTLDNAAKFTEGGDVRFTARRDNESLHVEIADTGAGIPEEDLPQLFNAFRVAGEETSSKYGGAGIGLALSGRLCELLGGTINVKSVLTQGSKFTITLPLANIQNQEPGARAA